MIETLPLWLVVVGLFLYGSVAGSFAGAQVWRLRARQLVDDKKAGEEYDKKEYKALLPLANSNVPTDRSRCLKCQHQLAWYDLIPVISWLSTRGRCRYCHQPIGWFEFVIELAMGSFFVLSFLLWPWQLTSVVPVILLALWLAMSVPLAVLFAYDAKWFLLPDTPMIWFTIFAATFTMVRLFDQGFSISALVSLIGAVLAISGLYWVLHAVSRGNWVGFGDVTLGVGLGLLLGRWELGLLTVFLANLIGTVLVLPGLLRGTLKRGSQLPFGPLLIIGMLTAFFFGQNIVDWYVGLL